MIRNKLCRDIIVLIAFIASFMLLLNMYTGGLISIADNYAYASITLLTGLTLICRKDVWYFGFIAILPILSHILFFDDDVVKYQSFMDTSRYIIAVVMAIQFNSLLKIKVNVSIMKLALTMLCCLLCSVICPMLVTWLVVVESQLGDLTIKSIYMSYIVEIISLTLYTVMIAPMMASIFKSYYKME